MESVSLTDEHGYDLLFAPPLLIPCPQTPDHTSLPVFDEPQEVLLNWTHASSSHLSQPTPSRLISRISFLTDEYAADDSLSVASPPVDYHSPPSRPARSPSPPSSPLSQPASLFHYTPEQPSASASVVASAFQRTPSPWFERATSSSLHSPSSSPSPPLSWLSSFHASPSLHRIASYNQAPPTPTLPPLRLSPVPSITNGLLSVASSPTVCPASPPRSSWTAETPSPLVSPLSQSLSSPQYTLYPTQSPSALHSLPPTYQQYPSPFSSSPISPSSSSSSVSSPSSPWSFPVSSPPGQVQSWPASVTIAATSYSAASSPHHNFALDDSTRIVLTYDYIERFKDDINRVASHFLYQANKRSPMAVLAVHRILQEARNTINNAVQRRTRTLRDNNTTASTVPTPDNTDEVSVPLAHGQNPPLPMEAQLWHYIETEVIPKQLAQESVRRSLDTMVMELASWEKHHRFDSIRTWNDFYSLCQHFKHFHSDLCVHYRSELGNISATCYEDTPVGVVHRILLAQDVMSSPDEHSFHQTLRTLSFAVTEDPVWHCRRMKNFTGKASTIFTPSPTVYPSKPTRLLKSWWTLPEPGTDVDRPEDIEPFTDLADTVDLFPYSQSYGGSATPLHATDLYTHQQATVPWVTVAEELFCDADGVMYTVYEHQGAMWTKPYHLPPPEKRQRLNYAAPQETCPAEATGRPSFTPSHDQLCGLQQYPVEAREPLFYPHHILH